MKKTLSDLALAVLAVVALGVVIGLVTMALCAGVWLGTFGGQNCWR